jgi:hypothetical protein
VTGPSCKTGCEWNSNFENGGLIPRVGAYWIPMWLNLVAKLAAIQHYQSPNFVFCFSKPKFCVLFLNWLTFPARVCLHSCHAISLQLWALAICSCSATKFQYTCLCSLWLFGWKSTFLSWSNFGTLCSLCLGTLNNWKYFALRRSHCVQIVNLFWPFVKQFFIKKAAFLNQC